MIGTFIVIVLLIFSVFLTCYKKNDLYVVLFLVICGPIVKLGNIMIDSSYVVIIYLFLKLFISKKSVVFNKTLKSYLILTFVNIFIYVCSTLIYSNIYNSTLISVIGFFKNFILLLLLYTLYYKNNTTLNKINVFVKYTLVLNFLASSVQMFTKSKFLDFFRTLYSTGNDSYSYLSNVYSYTRTYGLFRNGTTFAVFLLFSIAYLIANKSISRRSKVIYFVIAMCCGLMSATKTFVIGLPLIVILYGFITFFNNKKIKFTRKTILMPILVILFFPILIMCFSGIVNYLQDNGIYIKYYLEYLNNPFGVFNSRYNLSNDILLAKTYEVINEHPIIGVGLNSIMGEFLGDSTYVLALHNGGYLSLFTIIYYYISEIIKSFRHKKIYSLLFTIIMITTGFGISNLFNSQVIIPFFLFHILKEDNNDKFTFEES